MHQKRVSQRQERRGAVRVSSSPTPRRSTAINIDAVQIAANVFCLRQYSHMFVGGTPRRLKLSHVNWCVVPVVFTSPGHGVVGEVVVLAIDGQTNAVVGATPRSEVAAAAKRLREEKRHDIDAAFLRARKR